MQEDNEYDVPTFDTEAEFKAAGIAAFEEYLLSLNEGEEPKPGLQYVAVVKVGSGFQVCTMTFGQAIKPN